MLLDAPREKEVDHINGNTLDNRKNNLRICSRVQNSRNLHRREKGVDWNKAAGKWRSRITMNGNTLNLGYFKTKKEALVEYRKLELKLFKEYALL